MSTFVLVHGGWCGAWVWQRVTPLLEREGHTAIAQDLPGQGDDKTPASEISLEAYGRSICKILDAQPEPVILVGHSMGGNAIGKAATYRPERIKMLVYLTAFLMTSDVRVDGMRDSALKGNVIQSEDRTYTTLRLDAFDESLSDCSKEDIALVKSLMGPQYTLRAGQPATTAEKENFARVPRVYIECLLDQAIHPSVQKEMYTLLPCEKVISMNTAHMPFFSAPEELVAHLTSL